METFWFNYQQIILEFLFEIYVFYALVTWKLKREPHFWLRALGGLALVLAVAAGPAALYPQLGYTVAGRVGLYLFLFSATVLHVWLCYAENFATVLFCCSVAYAAQNLCYKLRLILVDVGRWHSGTRLARMPIGQFTCWCSRRRPRRCICCFCGGWCGIWPAGGWITRCWRCWCWC